MFFDSLDEEELFQIFNSYQSLNSEQYYHAIKKTNLTEDEQGNEKYASDFIDVAREHGLKGAFMGHAHNVDWTVEMEEGGNKLILGLGVKTGIELYYAHIDVNSNDDATKQGLKSLADRGCVMDKNFDLIGASLVTITDDPNTIEGKFDLEHLYLNERNTAKGYDEWWVRF